MNEVMKNILTKSIRAFLNREIPKEELEQIVQAGLYAPSGHNYQTWRFTVVTDRKEIQRLAKIIGEKLGREHYDMYNPQVLLVLLMKGRILMAWRIMPAPLKIFFWQPIPLA